MVKSVTGYMEFLDSQLFDGLPQINGDFVVIYYGRKWNKKSSCNHHMKNWQSII